MFVSFYTELGNSSIADERVFLLHFILQQGSEKEKRSQGTVSIYFGSIISVVGKTTMEIMEPF